MIDLIKVFHFTSKEGCDNSIIGFKTTIRERGA